MALVTDMDQPLGRWVGNAAEVLEAVHVLRGEGPSDVESLVVSLAGAMVSLGKDIPFEAARSQAAEKLRDGSGLGKFRELVEAQGGPDCAVPPRSTLHWRRGGWRCPPQVRDRGHLNARGSRSSALEDG